MSDPLFGYLDAGSGSMILQLFAGGLAAVAVAGRLFWHRILRILRIRKPEDDVAVSTVAAPPPTPTSTSESASRPDAP